MSISKPPYYHGTSKSSAKNILKNGINKSRLQSRDRGFFGDGFYVCSNPDTARHHSSTVGENNGKVLEIEINPNSNILYAGQTFTEHSITPTSKPKWHSSFIDWSLQKVKDAAVWEYATDKSKNEILSDARCERTPGSGKFDRQKWYNEVTEFAKSQGYDIVYWTPSEIIIKNTEVIRNTRIL